MIQPRTIRTLSGLAGAIALALAIGGCGSAGTQAPASAQPPVIPGEQTQGPDLSGVQLPNFVMPLIKGGVSLPNPKLTPGAVTTTNTNIVCNLPPHSTVPGLSSSLQTEAYTEYGDAAMSSQRKHILDWLVPYNLGGSGVRANIWPTAIRGVGFYEKIDTDSILRQMVCRRELTLTQAQQALEKNWYSAWLRYVVATGHI